MAVMRAALCPLLSLAVLGLDPRAAHAQAEFTGVAVADFEFRGTPIDPVAKLDAYAALLAPRGTPFVDDGPADSALLPIGTRARLRAGFAAIGYQAAVTAARRPDGVLLTVALTPADRVRHIFVEGNWPLRQDEIIRRLSLRPGHALPPAGEERASFLEAERARILTFLHSQGYLDARVELVLGGRPARPARVLLVVRIQLGPAYPIGDIRIEGELDPALDPLEIADAYRHGDWRFLWLRPAAFQQTVVREDTTDLVLKLRELGYPGARVYPTFNLRSAAGRPDRTVPLTLEIRQNKKIDVAFEGASCCADADLRELITLFQRGASDDVEVEASRDALARFFRERGNMFAQVHARREIVSDRHERVVFTVVEGPRLRVARVEVVGSQRFAARLLREVVSVRPYPFLGLGAGGHASLLQLQNDAQRLVDFYERQGYRDARARVEIGPRPDALRPIEDTLAGRDRDDWVEARRLYVRFTVLDEGRRVVVGRIRFRTSDGAPLPRPAHYLASSLLMRPGQPWREGLVRGDGGRLIRVMHDAGFSHGTAEPELSERDGAVDLTWTLTPGPRVKLGPIFIRGNFYTSDATILQWIPLRPGEPLTETAFERGQRQLSLLQYFTNANPIRFPGLEAGLPVVPMLVQVEERHDHWGIWRVGVGGATDQRTPGGDIPVGGFVSLGFEHGNLLGQGYFARSRLAIGNALVRGQADVENPRLLGTLFRLELSALYLRQQTVRLGDIRSGSAVVGLARQVHPGIDVFLRYGVRDIVRTEPFLRVAGADETQRTVQLDTLVGSVSTGIEVLRLDNLLVPQQGLRVHGSIEYAEPALTLGIGDDRFIKLHAAVLNLVPLSRKITLRHSLRYDHGIPLGTALLPKVERFFSGGDTTLRGYQFDHARIQLERAELSPGVNLVQIRPVGGNLRILDNLDLHYHLTGPLYVGAFLDSGALEDAVVALRPRRFRHGAGVTPLLVKLPIGDLAVSWAWPLTPGPGDARYGRLHFNVGLLF